MIFLVMNDQPERREGLKALLRQLNRQATAIDARDWRQAQRVAQRTPPDLLLIDWQSDWMTIADLRHFLLTHPRLPVAILADDAEPGTVATFLQAGALGVMPRDMAARLVVRACELVLLGGHYVPAGALDPAVISGPQFCAKRAEHLAGALTRKSYLEDVPPLSPRQHQIMRLVHLGNTNKVIARTLGISEGTVKIHLSSIFRALGATNRAAAVAIYNGWQYRGLHVLQNEAAQVGGIRQAAASANWLLAAQPEASYHVTPVLEPTAGARAPTARTQEADTIHAGSRNAPG